MCPVPTRAARSFCSPETKSFGKTAKAAPLSATTISAGRPLDALTRQTMEGRFGHDFSRVRVFADDAAHQAARSVHAAAFAAGPNLVFRQGRYQPGEAAGQRLLAHELAHVVQQERAGTEPADLAGSAVSRSGDAAEREASIAATQVTMGLSALVRAAPGAGIARSDEGDDGGFLGGLGGLAAGAASMLPGLSGGAAGSVTSMAASDIASVAGGNGASASGLSGLMSGAWDGGKALYDGYQKQTDFKPLQAGLGSGVDWLEGKVADGNQKMVDQAKGIPVLEQLAQGSAWLSNATTQATGGVVKGVGDLAGGVANTFFHPLDAAAGLEGILEHNATVPFLGSTLKAGHGLYDLAVNGGGQYGNNLGELANHVFNPLQQQEDDAKYNAGLAKSILAPGEKGWDAWKEKPVEAGARAITNLLPVILGVGEATAGAEAGEASAAGGRVRAPAVPEATPVSPAAFEVSPPANAGQVSPAAVEVPAPAPVPAPEVSAPPSVDPLGQTQPAAPARTPTTPGLGGVEPGTGAGPPESAPAPRAPGGDPANPFERKTGSRNPSSGDGPPSFEPQPGHPLFGPAREPVLPSIDELLEGLNNRPTNRPFIGPSEPTIEGLLDGLGRPFK